MLETYGAYKLEEKIQKRDITRRFYRRYPYDGWQKRAGMDTVDLVMPSNPHADLLDKEAHELLLDGLTPRELEVATLAEMGYKPKDMAAMRAAREGRPVGSATSNADRWMKHQVKQRFAQKLDEEVY